MACENIPKAENGQPSFLFESLLNSGLDRNSASEIYYRVHTPEFKKNFGDWQKNNLGDLVDHNGEPRLEYIMATQDRVDMAKKFHNIFLDENLSFDMPSFTEVFEETPKYVSLLADYKYRLAKVNDQMVFARRNKDKKKEFELEKQIQTLKDFIEDIKKARKLEDIQVAAEKDLAEVAETLNKPKVGLAELNLAKQKLHTWQKGIDLFFDEEERVESSLVDNFLDYELRARNLEKDLIKIEDSYIKKFVKDTLGVDVTNQELYEMKKDISSIYADTQDISKVDDMVFQALHRAVKNKNSVSSNQIKKVIKSTDDLVKRLVNKYGKDYSNKFLQKDSSGNLTVSVISPWSFDFLDTKDSLRKSAFGENSTPEKVKSYYDFIKENEILMDPNLLFGEDQTLKETHIKELESHMGKEETERRLKFLENKIEDYQNDAEAVKDSFTGELGDTNGMVAFREWELDNSPFLYAKRMTGKTPLTKKADGTFPKNNGARYLYSVPRKYDKAGKETKWYDSRFADIQKDSDLMEFYNHYMDTIKEVFSYLPEDQLENLRLNSIIGIKKTVLDLFSEQGMKAGLTGVWDSVKDSITVNSTNVYGTEYIDPVTQTAPMSMRMNSVESLDNKVNVRIKEKIADYTFENGVAPGKGMVKKFTTEARNEVTSESITDLGRILKAFSALSIAYKHKTEVEDYLKLSKSLLDRQVELQLNPAGESIIDPISKEQRGKTVQESYKHKKEMLDYFIDVQYGKGQDIEYGTDKVLYTSEEQVRKKVLEKRIEDNKKAFEEGKISEEEFNTNNVFFQEEIDKLGSKLNLGKVGDQILTWVRVKGMGWNPMSATSNMLFGIVSNVIEGSDGRVYTNKSFWKAYSLTMNSVAKSLSFNTIQTPTAKKIRALMDKFDVLKEISQELYQTKRHEWEGNLKNIHPMNLNKITEYINQAPIMIAIMMDTSITINGKETNLWEAFNEEGELEGYEVGDSAFNSLKAKIDKIIKQNHGNYDPDSPLKLKKKLWKRALGQFRTFMLEGFEARFGEERPDADLGMRRKGRYRSYLSYYGNTGAVKGTAFMAKQLLRKLFWQKTQFDQLIDEDGFTEVDAANMRKNMTGLVMLASVAILYLLGKAAVEDDDKKLAAYNWYMNQLLRVQTDLTFYANPTSFEALTKQSIPAMSVVSDTVQVFNAFYKFLLGEDTINSGIHADDSRIVRELMQWAPGTSPIYGLYNSSKQVYDK